MGWNGGAPGFGNFDSQEDIANPSDHRLPPFKVHEEPRYQQEAIISKPKKHEIINFTTFVIKLTRKEKNNLLACGTDKHQHSDYPRAHGWRRYMRKEKEEHEYRVLLVAFSVVPREDNGDGGGRVFRWS
ncbi:hypothetical protein ACFX2C_010000 [Malus domestica]